MAMQRAKTLFVWSAVNALLASAFNVERTPGQAVKKPSGAYPFNQLVVFGDQFSDNGNGSYAYGLDANNIYGFHTWTDGPIAASYLAGYLGVPSLNYAFGGANNGALAGATTSNTYTPSQILYKGKPVPSSQDQIANYTSHSAAKNIKNALQFIWIGQNDLKAHTDWWEKDTSLISPTNFRNVEFYNNYTSLLLPQVETLIRNGAPAVMVVNFPPLQTTPECKYFLCKTRKACYNKWASVIEAGNTHMQQALQASKYASKIIYYDVYAFWTQMMANKNSYGFTEPLVYYCDGNHSEPDNKWSTCIKDLPSWSAARPFFYFTNDQPETHGHMYIAQDMATTINKFFNVTSS